MLAMGFRVLHFITSRLGLGLAPQVTPASAPLTHTHLCLLHHTARAAALEEVALHEVCSPSFLRVHQLTVQNKYLCIMPDTTKVKVQIVISR